MRTPDAMNARRILLELLDAALRAVDGRVCVARQLRTAKLPGPVAVFAVGKAASSMALGAVDSLGAAIQSLLLITKDGHTDPGLARLDGAMILESAHPVPDERSLAAGIELRRRLVGLPADVTPLFLISGGSSSLVEWLQEGATLEDLRTLNQRGLASGWDIATLNGERRRLSRLKGGGVARLLAGRGAMALFISDVPGDDPEVIGSGLLGTDGGRADRIERQVIANVESAVRAVLDAGMSQGLELAARNTRFDGDADAVAGEMLEALRCCPVEGIVWGGESTTTLPREHGRGGRNTHLALSFARRLRANEPWLLLAAGTDGTDGPTDDAGAIVDSGTVERAMIGGCDVERAWAAFDSGTALEASEDLVHTGPTGTNVGDILIGLKSRSDASGRML